MNTIGSHPGAILFRMSIMVTLIAILVVVFFVYVGNVQQNTERAAIIRTKGLIDSSLAIVFATYAVESRLDELSDLEGANPFEFLREYIALPDTYQGEVETGLGSQFAPGWYYLTKPRQVAYKSRYLDHDLRFRLVVNYEDRNGSGRYEADADKFGGIYFTPITGTETIRP